MPPLSDIAVGRAACATALCAQPVRLEVRVGRVRPKTEVMS
jgi:hypothetical protein